jgi:Fur family ferric uptake transcriptional regulator
MSAKPNEGKNQPYRMTRQREVILEEIRQARKHPSADEVYEMVRKRLPRISLGTVYRNLEILSELGEIQKLEFGDLKRFDWNPNKHYHIRCMNCGRVDDAPIAPLKRIEDELYGSTVYTIFGHRLVFEGLCPACTRQAEAKEGRDGNPPYFS